MPKANAYVPKSRTFTYKTLSFLGKPFDLQKLLIEAYKALPRARSRSKHLPEDEDVRRVMNFGDPTRNMTTGMVYDYTKGQSKSCVEEDEDAQNFSISAIAPPSDGKKRREFLDSIIYFAILENHIVMLSSVSTGLSHLESYLNWLLLEAGVIKESQAFRLVDRLPDNVRLRGVKSIKFKEGNAFRPTAGRPKSDSATVEKNIIPDSHITNAVKTMVKQLLQEQRGSKSLAEVAHPDDIDVKIEIICKNLRKDDEEPMLDDMAELFRHTQGVDAEFELVGGGTVNSDKMKISQIKSIRCIGGIPDSADLWSKMADWLEHLVQSGKVSAE
jgi:hypothetical protein